MIPDYKKHAEELMNDPYWNGTIKSNYSKCRNCYLQDTFIEIEKLEPHSLDKENKKQEILKLLRDEKILREYAKESPTLSAKDFIEIATKNHNRFVLFITILSIIPICWYGIEILKMILKHFHWKFFF